MREDRDVLRELRDLMAHLTEIANRRGTPYPVLADKAKVVLAAYTESGDDPGYTVDTLTSAYRATYGGPA